jgi:hypothetical protein
MNLKEGTSARMLPLAFPSLELMPARSDDEVFVADTTNTFTACIKFIMLEERTSHNRPSGQRYCLSCRLVRLEPFLIALIARKIEVEEHKRSAAFIF